MASSQAPSFLFKPSAMFLVRRNEEEPITPVSTFNKFVKFVLSSVNNFQNLQHKINTMKKTNTARILDSQKIVYEMVEYTVNEDDLSAAAVAAKLGQDVEQVFKTLVMRGNANGIFVAVVPGDAEVDLKKAAKVSGNKNAEMVPMKELLNLTGYIRGGCSPLGMKKPYPIFIHETCLLFDNIFISGGKRGLQLKLDPKDLISCTGATLCDLIGD